MFVDRPLPPSPKDPHGNEFSMPQGALGRAEIVAAQTLRRDGRGCLGLVESQHSGERLAPCGRGWKMMEHAEKKKN